MFARKGIKKQFWLSEKDAVDLKRKAQKCGVTETTAICQPLRGYEPREKPDERFYAAMQEMYAIGNNLNQLNPVEKQQIIPNTHEAIIDEPT